MSPFLTLMDLSREYIPCNYMVEEKPFIVSAAGWLTDIVVVLMLAFFIAIHFGTSIQMGGHSMETTAASGDILLVDTLSYTVRKPERYDVILLTDDYGEQTVKRIIALPGETVQIINGDVYINGEKLADLPKSLQGLTGGLAETGHTVAKGEYFVIGDNPASSEDSRYEKMGDISFSQIDGRIWFSVTTKKAI